MKFVLMLVFLAGDVPPQPNMAFKSLSTCIKAADHLNKENDKELIGVGARFVCFAPVHGERT